MTALSCRCRLLSSSSLLSGAGWAMWPGGESLILIMTWVILWCQGLLEPDLCWAEADREAWKSDRAVSGPHTQVQLHGQGGGHGLHHRVRHLRPPPPQLGLRQSGNKQWTAADSWGLTILILFRPWPPLTWRLWLWEATSTLCSGSCLGWSWSLSGETRLISPRPTSSELLSYNVNTRDLHIMVSTVQVQRPLGLWSAVAAASVGGSPHLPLPGQHPPLGHPGEQSPGDGHGVIMCLYFQMLTALQTPNKWDDPKKPGIQVAQSE